MYTIIIRRHSNVFKIRKSNVNIKVVASGKRGLTGAQGADGVAGEQGVPGEGVPVGGTTGQYLKKSSGVDFATIWATIASDEIVDTASAHKFVTAAQISLINAALQPGGNISDLVNDAGYLTSLSGLTTTNLAEGTNLYYTNERVDDRVATLIQEGTGISWSYNDAGGTLTPTVTLAPFTTTNLAEGANLYYTNDRADARISLQKAQANGLATLGSDGLIPTSQLPALAITDTFVVASQVAMLALTAEVGDIAVRTDLNKTYILKTAGASTLGNWQELLTPTDTVLSVNGQTGAVVLTTTNIAEGTNEYYTSAKVQTVGDARYLQKSNNLSELTNVVTARLNLGLVIGTNVQAYDAELAALAGLTSAADKLPYFTGSGTASVTDFTSFARTLVATSNAAGAISALGLDADIATLSLPASTTISTFGASLVDDADAATARTTLGLVAAGAGDIWVEKAGDTMTGELVVDLTTASTSAAPLYGLTLVDGGARFSGAYNETSTTAGVHVGAATGAGASPRIGFFNGTASQNWQIDNQLGSFRWFLPGVVHVTLTSNGFIVNNGFTANENGGNFDCRFEGDTDVNLLFTKASTDMVGISTSSPTSKFYVNGSFGLALVAKTSTYTATSADYTIKNDATSGAITINLPTASGISGRIYTIKKVDSSGNAVTVDPNGSETIDGAATYSLATQWKYVTIQSDGTNWIVIGNN